MDLQTTVMSCKGLRLVSCHGMLNSNSFQLCRGVGHAYCTSADLNMLIFSVSVSPAYSESTSFIKGSGEDDVTTFGLFTFPCSFNYIWERPQVSVMSLSERCSWSPVYHIHKRAP